MKASLTGLRASLGAAEIRLNRKQDKIMDTSIYRGTPLRPTSLMGKPLPPLGGFSIAVLILLRESPYNLGESLHFTELSVRP